MAKILRYYLEKDPDRNSEDAKLTMDLFEEKLRKRLANLEIERRNIIEELSDLERKLRLLEESIQNNSNV
ncbi:MAG: hypothetical protein LBD88_02015 [Candidatus Peribacteria bacterium]|jgi:undecaprenyl pyrophosphate synthase|nr:hypothetical protein [Candidatus Peribacteria bacterium]